MNSLRIASQDKSLPKYQRVESAILDHIRDGKLQPGDRLPGERALAQLTGVSAVTASRGVNRLVLRGILERRQGQGTFVTSANPHQRSAETKRIGLFTRYGAGDPYLTDIVRGMTEVLAEDGYELLIMSAHGERHLPNLREYNLAGLVVVAPLRNRVEELQHIRAANAPLIVVGYRYPELEDITFSCDDYGGGQMAAEHLVSLGHQRIGVLGARNHPAIEERVNGFRKGMFVAGMPFDPDWELLSEHYETIERDADIMAKLTRLLTSANRPTALFAASSSLLLVAYAAAQAANLKIPQDLSLVGFDEAPHGEYVSPAPTVLRQPVKQIGINAGRALLATLREETSDAVRRHPTTLVGRNSCARWEGQRAVNDSHFKGGV